MNHSNKDGKLFAESEEGRPLIKENICQPNTYPTQSEKRVSQGLMKLTWDRGLEMAKHKEFTVTDVQVYFCGPQRPWQRGSNENTNLLLRLYFPKGTELSSIAQEQLDLNQRPRKTLGFQTPAAKLQVSVASTT